MNGLTLRLSCDKKIKPIKKDVQKEDIELLLSQNAASQLKTFEKLLAAASVEEQVQAIKEIFSSISYSDAEDGVVIDILVHIFLSLKPKSPLSPPLLKFLSTVPEKYLDSIQCSITKWLNDRLQKKELPVNEILDVSLALQLCLDHRQALSISLKPCLPQILLFLKNSLQDSHKLFQNETIPINKLRIINTIHSCIQVGISSCQEYEVGDLTELNFTVIEIISNSDLPIDTRAAGGVLAAHLSSSISPSHWLEVFQNILNSGNELGVLSFCSGLLVVLTEEELFQQVDINGCTDHALNLFYKIILDIEEKNASESGIVLSAARCIVLLTRSLSKLSNLLTENFLSSLLIYVWSHIEHYMDAVRHLALSVLTNLQAIAQAHPELNIFENISKDLEGMSVERRSKHAAISALVSHVPINKIIAQSPGLVHALLKAALANPSSNYAINSLEKLMEQDLKEQVDREEWFELWVKPLLQAPLSAPLEQLLTTVVKIHPCVIENVVSLGLDKNNKNISVILTCVKIGRKFNLLKGQDNNEKWKGIVDLQILENCMYHTLDDVRLSCFSLLIETSKSTEEFSTTELNLIEIFFKYNFNNQEPSVRQKSLAFCKKFLTRLRESRASLERRQMKCARSETTYENISCILAGYSSAVKCLRTMCLDSLFPGSSPARRSFALSILALYKELGFWNNFDDKSAQVLLSCLLDSYEENKAIAKNLLSSMPPQLLKFEDEEHLKKYIDETLRLGSSIRPPDSISAAYYMSLLATYTQLKSEMNIDFGTAYFCLSTTLESLKSELAVAKESLLQAACTGPLYGYLFVIRHLLQDINLGEMRASSEWQALIEDIIEIAFECNGVVSHVVYNSSPEGHLPMDFTYCSIKKDSDPQVTSQMVLLCSWRTVKEVSLLLGELSERATIAGDENDQGLLSKRQILAIGQHLTALLSETKHRGAFEQAYLGFSKLAARLWRCSSADLHELPRKWLDETLECISNNENLSATRRSAGIPFIVQALICSELDSGSCKSLHKAMISLLEIAQNGSSEGRVHALNILRALYRGSTLGEAVGPYVANGISTALAGFNSNTWAERNSSTLLLSALMSRVFGVPRGKSETLSWRNKMTGRLFFQRYPSLYTDLLKHLESSSRNQMYPALYPVLLLLGRLYPSSLEGTDSNLQLMKYLPYVLTCSESSILKTRTLAATAVSSLVSSASYVDFISQLIQTLSHVEKENHRHGILLMVHKLIQQLHSHEDKKNMNIKSEIDCWMKTLLECLTSLKCSFVSKDACIQIILQLFLSFNNEISETHKLSIEKNIKNILFYESPRKCISHYGCEILYVHASILLLTITFKDKRIPQFVQDAIKLLQKPNYEVLDVTLDLLIFILSGSEGSFSPSLNEGLKLEFHDNHISSKLKAEITNSEELMSLLINKILHEHTHHEEMVKLLDVLQFFRTAFQTTLKDFSFVQFLCKMCKESSSSVSSKAIRCLNSFFKYQGEADSSEINQVCEIIEEFSNAEATDDCREAVTSLLSNNFDTLLQKSSFISKLILWTGVVRLMVDENGEIRRGICSALIGDVVPSRGLELLLSQFISQAEPQTAITALLFWAVGCDSDSFDLDDGSLFDKGPANTYSEELVLNRLACKELEHLVREKEIPDLSFDDSCSQWLYERTNIRASTLISFVSAYKNSINNCDNLNNLLPYRPYENKYLLQMYKLENLLSATSML